METKKSIVVIFWNGVAMCTCKVHFTRRFDAVFLLLYVVISVLHTPAVLLVWIMREHYRIDLTKKASDLLEDWRFAHATNRKEYASRLIELASKDNKIFAAIKAENLIALRKRKTNVLLN